MAITVGTTVVTPSGREAKVRAVEKYMSGKRGRPALYAVVQLRDAKGRKLTKTKKVYWISDLQAA